MINAAVVQRKFTLLNRVPFGKFNRVNVLIQGDLFAMREVDFLVKLPEGATVPKGPGISVYPCLQSRKPSSEVKNLQRVMMLSY